MRSDKPKLSQPPRLKSIPRFQLTNQPPHSEASQRSAIDEVDPIFLHKTKTAFDQTSFKTKYQRALDLIAKNKQSDSRNALTILEFLCGEIPKLPPHTTLTYQLLQNVVTNTWRLKNSFKDTQPRRQQALIFIRNFVAFFAETYRREQVHKNGLHMLYLIQANEQFDQKMYLDSLKSCELSIKHCGSVKNQAHLLKVEYLKCNIHSALGNHREEAESIRRSLFFINTLMASTIEENLKDYVNQLKKNLLSRQAYLKDNPTHQKSLETKKTSFSLFRKRSLSHKRRNSQKQITVTAVQKKNENMGNSLKNSNKGMVKSIHTRSANISKYNPSSKQERTTFLPVDLTKFNRTQQKLKKRPLKITQRHRANDFQESRGNIMDQIQQMAPVMFNYESLMVRRPNQLRKSSLKKSTKINQAEQAAFEQVSINQQVMSKKQSNRQAQQEKIQPVTHYIAKSMHTNDQVLEQQQEDLIRECVHFSQEALLRTFLRKLTQEEQSQFNEKISVNASNHGSRIDSSSSSDFSSSNQIKNNNQQPAQITVNRSEANTQFEFFQTDLDYDSNFDLSQNLQLITYAGILSRFKFSIKSQKKQHLDESQQFYKELYISFCTVMNKIQWLHSTITFRYYNPFQKNLEIILDEICKNQLQDAEEPSVQSVKQRLLSLMANRLLIVRKPNGVALVQKQKQLVRQDNLSSSYTQYLKNNFIIYEQNKLTNFPKNKAIQEIDFTAKRNKQTAFRLKLQYHPKENQQDLNAFHQILNYYLPKLIRRMTDDLKEQKSSISSVKRMKTERFYKDTILSFKSLIRSMNQSDVNTKITFDDQKSLSLVMPSDFNSKVSNFFEHQEGARETSIYEFYYCMKFILIQPSKIEKIQQIQPSQTLTRKRRSTIDNIVKQKQKQFQIVKPKYLENTLGNFYDEIQVQHLFQLGGKWHAHIRMTCFKVKQVFKKTEEYFYKFEMQFKGERIKMMKFIATSYDIYLLVIRRNYQIKSSRKKEKIPREDYQIPIFNRFSLLALLKQISQRIFVKKDYIYSLIGLETISPHFSYINKFRLQGKTVQNKQFMIPHLKCIHILLQKSLKIICDHFREYAVLTIRHVEKCTEFNVIFYLPAHQRTFSINLNTTIIQYLTPQHKSVLFEKETPLNSEETLKILFSSYEESEVKPLQTRLWNNFSKLFKFQVNYYEDKMQMLLKIGNYVAFLKDSCFSQFFELKDKIFHLEMSLQRKSQLNSSEFQLKNGRKMHLKRISASSKELIKRNNFLVAKDMKSSGRVLKPSISKKCTQNQEQLFRKADLFDRLNKVYETETSKYIIYISLSKIYGIAEGQLVSQCEPRRVNLSFYLSDLITLLKESKKELYTKQEKIYNEFNQEVFSFAILLRAMTIIKYRLINELKRFRDLDSLFDGENTISIQKQFKNTLTKAFCAQNDNLYSLNSSKKLYKLSDNIYLINKNLMPGKRNVIVSIFYDQKCKRVKFYLTNVGELTNKQKMYLMREMKFPWIQLYQKEQLFKISPRIYNYYKNILLCT